MGGVMRVGNSAYLKAMGSPSFLRKAVDGNMNAYMNNSTADRDAIINAVRRSNNYQDFLKQSGLQARADAYNKAYASAPEVAYLKSTGERVNNPHSTHREYDHGWDGDVFDYDQNDIEYRKDMSGYADSTMGSTANSILTNSQLESWFNDNRNAYGRETTNADAGAVYSGNVSSGGDGSASGAASGGNRRQGGDQVTTDATRTDNRGDDTLLGGRGGGRLKEKETLF